MAEVLYHPEHGYYARRSTQVGSKGDFFTSVSVGPLFGRLLARRFLDWWRAGDRPAPWRIIEAGAHTGILAADILAEIRGLDPAAFAALEYVIPEPLPLLRSAQCETLAGFPNIRLVQAAAGLAADPLPGIAFGNEVIDALPFHVIRREQGTWREQLVDFREGSFVWASGDHFPEGPEGNFPEGYRTEIRTCHGAFLRPLLDGLSHGLLLWPDYGYETRDYYHPDRITGTLRTFSNHRAGDDPFDSPGDTDITAHVDFTALARDAMELGCRPLRFRTQSSWLTSIASELLLSMEGKPDPEVLRQFQTLTHPGHLGTRFHVLELSWNDPSAPPMPSVEMGHLGLGPA